MTTFTLGLSAVVLMMVLQQVASRSRLAALTWGLSCFVAPALFACLLLSTQPASVEGDQPGSINDYQHSGSIFLTFHGVRRPLQGDFRIGGSDEADFLFERLPEDGDVAVIDSKGLLRVSTAAIQGERFAAVQGSIKDLSRQGSVPTWALLPGSTMCFASPGTTTCADKRDWRWTIKADGELMVSGPVNVLPEERKACTPSRFIGNFSWQARLRRVPTAQDRIFPLDVYGRVDCAGDAVEPVEKSALDRTFLHFDESGHLFVTQLPAATGRVLVVENARKVGAAVAGEPSVAADFDLSVFRLQVSPPLPNVESRRRLWMDIDSAESSRSRLVGVDALQVRFLMRATSATMPDTLQVTSARPAVVKIPPAATCRQSTIVNLMGARERHRSMPDEANASERTARVPFLADMGRIGSSGALVEVHRNSVDVSPWEAHGCRSFSRADITINGATGTIEHVRGTDLVGVGAPSHASLLMSVAEYGVPGMWILGLLLALALLRCLLRVTAWHTLVQASLVSATLMMVDTLLVTRLVVAVQEMAVQPQLGGEVVPALLIVLLVPFVLELMVVARNRLGRGSVWRAFVGWYQRLRGAALRRAPAGQTSLASDRLACPSQWMKWLHGKMSRTQWLVRALALGANVMKMLLVLAVPLLHLALVSAGFREQIAGVRITAIFVPAYVVLLAVLVSWAGRHAPRTWHQRLSFPLLVVSAALALLAFVFARDSGAVITLTGAFIALTLVITFARRSPGRLIPWPAAALAYVALVLMAIVSCAGMLLYAGHSGLTEAALLHQHPALFGWSLFALAIGGVAVFRWRSTTGWLFAAPGVLVVLVLVALSTARFDRRAVDCSLGDVLQVAACLESQSLDTNRLRLAYLIYPALSRLNLAGEARGMNAVFDELEWVTSSFPVGGLMSVPPRMGLDQNDNAIASHIIGPQGRASAWLLCVAITLPFLFLVTAKRHRRLGLRRPLPWLAYGCFAFTSTYMVLGNLMLVPFTGRNVYLTNAFSGSDLLEGGLLILLVLMPLAAMKGHRPCDKIPG